MEELEGAKLYHDKHQRCVYCDMVDQEYKDNDRIVTENDDFVVFCPFVPRYPFECWVLPKKHISDFASLTGQEQIYFAAILRETLWRIRQCLSDSSYNFYLHISPINENRQESFHWHVEIVPKLTEPTGFEWGTGFYVVRTAPNMAAKYLREVE